MIEVNTFGFINTSATDSAIGTDVHLPLPRRTKRTVRQGAGDFKSPKNKAVGWIYSDFKGAADAIRTAVCVCDLYM